MSKYLDRLKARKLHLSDTDALSREKSEFRALPKLSKGAFVSNSSAHISAFSDYYINIIDDYVHHIECNRTQEPLDSTLSKPPKADLTLSLEQESESEKPSDSTLPKLPKVAPPSIAEFEERAAILEHDGGLARDQAEREAAIAFGFETPDALYQAILFSWQQAIEGAVSDSLYVAKLKASSLQFLAGPHAMQAVKCGWDELSLFGIFNGSSADAARSRLGARGLLPSVAWSSIGLQIQSIHPEHAVFSTTTGAVQRQRRFQSEIELSIPWWRNEALLSERRAA